MKPRQIIVMTLVDRRYIIIINNSRYTNNVLLHYQNTRYFQNPRPLRVFRQSYKTKPYEIKIIFNNRYYIYTDFVFTGAE